MLLTDIKGMNIQGKDVKELHLNGSKIWTGGKPYDTLWDMNGYAIQTPSNGGLIIDYVPTHTTRVRATMMNLGYKTTSSYYGDKNVFFGANDDFYFYTIYYSTNSFSWYASNGSSNSMYANTSGNTNMYKYEQVRTITVHGGACLTGGPMMSMTPLNDRAITSRLVIGQYGENPPDGFERCMVAISYLEIGEDINGVHTTVRQFYPAMKDGVYGLYDKITGTFCGQTTSGSNCSLKTGSLFTVG